MIWAALVLGFVGSLHCVGMCGPIAIAAFGNSKSLNVAARLSYNLGRVITYSFFGLMVGLLGRIIQISGVQQWISIIAGSIIVFLALAYLLGMRSRYRGFDRVMFAIKKNLAVLLKKRGISGRFSLGIINGFLPCGLVYMALAGAVVTESSIDSVLFMLFFGLGTIPAMFGITYVAPAISRIIDINRWIPYIFAIVGIILVLRGMGLGIPFISPDLEQGAHSMHTGHTG